MKLSLRPFSLTFSVSTTIIDKVLEVIQKYMPYILLTILSAISCFSFYFYLNNKLGLSYNDARSHLDIGRRVVEGLKPGLAQIGSVWLPLPHLLMIPTIWNDYLWHTGLSGALQSMASFVLTAMIIYLFLKELKVDLVSRLVGVFVFVANINILYLQSTAMTELLLLGTMTAGVYELFLWQKRDSMINLLYASFWVMLSTLIRYDGWFLFLYVSALIIFLTYKKAGRKAMEGTFLFYATLSGVGIALWFLWNLLIFKDPLYFILGPFSAHAQQQQLASAGVLATQKNLLLSIKVYWYALAFNSDAFLAVLSLAGAIALWTDAKIKSGLRWVSSALIAPLIFNILALYLGFSVLFVQGISGDTWFNVRYGIMMAPSIAIFIGYLVYRLKPLRVVLIGLILFATMFTFLNNDAVTIDDARVGSSQKNVSQVAGWLNANAKDKDGFILISAASHDAIIFSSGLPMSKFIHEGTGAYWTSATTAPDRWARWIVMRTNDMNDLTFRSIYKTKTLSKYTLVAKYPFADVYELKPEYLSQLTTKPIFANQK